MSSSLEGNKIAAAVLTAGVIAMTSGFIAELVYHPKDLEQNVYTVAAVVPEAGAATAAASGPAYEPIDALLAAADPAAGEKLIKKCTACHTLGEGEANKIGPNLWNIVNRPIGGGEGYSYSAAMSGMSDKTWDYAMLNGFLFKPKVMIEGTKMSFGGLKKVEDRANLVAYLRSLSGSPAPLP